MNYSENKDCELHKAVIRPTLNSSGSLSDEALVAIEELCGVLKEIREQMIYEGYEIVDGVIRDVITKKPYEPNKYKNRKRRS